MEQSIWNGLLGEACHRELMEVIRLLVKEDPQIIAAHDNLLIRWAAYNGKTQLASLLIEAGADVTADDNYAVKYAASDRNYELIFLLVEAGATLGVESLYSWKQAELDRLLIEAVDKGLTGLVSLSIEASALKGVK